MVQVIQTGPSTQTLRQAALNDALSGAINSWGEMQKTQRQQAMEYAKAVNDFQAQNPNANLTEQEAAQKVGLGDQYTKNHPDPNTPSFLEKAQGAISKLFAPAQDSQAQPQQIASQDANAQKMTGDSLVAKGPVVALANDQQATQGNVSNILKTASGDIDLSQYSSADQKIIKSRIAQQATAAAQQKIENENKQADTLAKIASGKHTSQETNQMLKDSGSISQQKLADIRLKNAEAEKNIAMALMDRNRNQSTDKSNLALIKYQDGVKAIRSNEAYNKAESGLAQANKIFSNLKDDMTDQERHAVAEEAAKLLSGGVATKDGTDALLPHNWSNRAALAKDFVTGGNTRTNNKEWADSMRQLSKRMTEENQKFIAEKRGEELLAHAPSMTQEHLEMINKSDPATYDNYVQRLSGTHQAVTQNQANPKNVGNKASADTPQAPHGNTVTQNGHTYTWNPSKGKYE